MRRSMPTTATPDQERMKLDIGAKKPVDGDQVFVVGQCVPSFSEPPFVLLYDAARQQRAKRNIHKMAPVAVVAALGPQAFTEIQYPGWGRVWFRRSGIRRVRALRGDELVNSSKSFGCVVLFHHDPDPEDEHAGFLLFGIEAGLTAQLLGCSLVA
jgi:hypothetical protein